MTGPLQSHREGPRLTLVLARPAVHNALDEDLMAALETALRQAPAAGVRYVVLAGEGPSFCAGADLAWMHRAARMNPEENRQDAERLAALLDAIVTCPLPVIARVHGAVLGGGVGLVAACDLAVATPAAVFGLSEVRLGLAPAVIFPVLLHRMTPSPLLQAALTGERFTADAARAMGLVHEVADDPDAVIARWAASLLAAPPGALAAVKTLFHTVPHLPRDEARAFTVGLLARLRAGEEAQEGIRAFLERRRPRWAPPAS
jgi:methylglutaconyl-CoA hydratase